MLGYAPAALLSSDAADDAGDYSDEFVSFDYEPSYALGTPLRVQREYTAARMAAKAHYQTKVKPVRDFERGAKDYPDGTPAPILPPMPSDGRIYAGVEPASWCYWRPSVAAPLPQAGSVVTTAGLQAIVADVIDKRADMLCENIQRNNALLKYMTAERSIYDACGQTANEKFLRLAAERTLAAEQQRDALVAEGARIADDLRAKNWAALGDDTAPVQATEYTFRQLSVPIVISGV